MKIAIIGNGFIANTHAQELTGMGRKISVVVGNESHAENARAFQQRWNIDEVSFNFNRVLEDDISVVHVCTPPTIHYEMVKKLVLAGKHVICEKPFCLEAGQARELYEMAKERKLVTAVNFNVRYHDACQQIRQRVSSGELGRILMIHGGYEQEFHALPAEYSWRYLPTLAGKMRATTEIGSHWIDLARFLSGLEIIAVSATYGKFQPDRYEKGGLMYADFIEGSTPVNVDSDDAVLATLRLSNGALASLFLSEITHGRNNYVNIELTGTDSTLRWNSESPYKVESAKKFAGTLTRTNAFGGGFPNTFSAFFREVYKDMDAGVPSYDASYPSFYDGYLNAAVCEAIYTSANNHSIWTEVK